MLRLATDEDFNSRIVRGLLRRQPELDIVRAQDAELSAKDDPEILAWAAREQRVLLTHDVTTMKQYAYERIAAGLPMPGVAILRTILTIGQAVNEVELVAIAGDPDDVRGLVLYLPL